MSPVSSLDTARVRASDELAALQGLAPDEAAKKVEGLFASLLLQEMRRTLPSGSFFGGGPGADVYDGMLETALGESLAERGAFGLGDLVREDALRRAPAEASADLSAENAS